VKRAGVCQAGVWTDGTVGTYIWNRECRSISARCVVRACVSELMLSVSVMSVRTFNSSGEAISGSKGEYKGEFWPVNVDSPCSSGYNCSPSMVTWQEAASLNSPVPCSTNDIVSCPCNFRHLRNSCFGSTRWSSKSDPCLSSVAAGSSVDTVRPQMERTFGDCKYKLKTHVSTSAL
jgi:hypothetical protein